MDLGNTGTTIGLFDGRRQGRLWRVYGDEVPKISHKSIHSGMGYKAVCLVCSVIPQRTAYLKKKLARKFRAKWYEIGRDIRVRINHNYRNFNRLGNDRKVKIYGAIRLYRPPFLVVDAGTAITFDFVSRNGVFEGGLIFPGPRISAEALHEKTALLPFVSLGSGFSSLTGRSTQECIRGGLTHGYSSLVRGIIELFRKRYGRSLLTIGTGGSLGVLRTPREYFDILDPYLTMRSLYLLYQSEILGQKPTDRKAR